MTEVDESLGIRIRKLRLAEGLTQQKLADAIGMSWTQVSRWETDKETPRPSTLRLLAKLFDVPVKELTVGKKSEVQDRGFAEALENSKALVLGDVRLDAIHVLRGNSEEQLHIGVRYDPKPLTIKREFRRLYEQLAERKKEEALLGNHDYFPNGPCTRLIRAIPNTRSLSNGREQRAVILELGPVSWEEYTVLNDYPEIRERYRDYQTLYNQGCDLRWCPLSNLLTFGMVPITSDGYGIVQHRSGQVSSDIRQITCGIAENIHRYLDEAPADDLTRRLHSLIDVPDSVRWNPAAPKGVPSPFLTAQRGLYEELSPELYRLTNDTSRFKFLCITFDLVRFLPGLIGVIELDLSRKETESMIEKYPGTDHSEYTHLTYLPLDITAPETVQIVSDQSRWVPGGLAAFVSTVKYWKGNSLGCDS